MLMETAARGAETGDITAERGSPSGTGRPKFLERSVIIAAHPDDELLWFSSILRDVDQVILVFNAFWGDPGIGERRKAALAEHPHRKISSLDIEEAGSYGCADWRRPRPNETGIAFAAPWRLRGFKRRLRRGISALTARDYPPPALSAGVDYRRNYSLIRAALGSRLTPEMNVFTHNPWGEYGHEDHVQTFRAVESLRDEIGFTLWVSNYCTERTFPLAARYFDGTPTDYVRMETDKEYNETVAEVYRRHDCWTWADDWAWFDEECFMPSPKLHERPFPHRHLSPLNMFTIGR